MTLRTVLILAAMVAFISVPSFACSCAYLDKPTKCTPPKKSDVVFLGTVIDIENPATEKDNDQGGDSRYHFRVDEAFSGTNKSEIDVYSGRGGGDCSYHFQPGEQYLVFPDGSSTGQLYVGICGLTRAANQAKPFLAQLRALRDHAKVASLYGSLFQSQSISFRDDDSHALANIKIKLQADGATYESTTDDEGIYEFFDLPAGIFKMSAILPANYEFDRTYSDRLLKLPAGACYEHDLYAFPTGRIRGQVIGPDQKPLRYASLNLFPVDKYKEDVLVQPTQSVSQSKKDYFEFNHIAAGDYFLVFNSTNEIAPNTPYPRFYYPGVTDLAKAQTIHIETGQSLDGMNILLQGRPLTRYLTVKLVAQGGGLPDIHYVEATGQDGSSPSNYDISQDTIQVPIFRNVLYSIQGAGYCSSTHTEAKTPIVEVSGADESTTEITLTYPKSCPSKRNQ